MGHIVFSLLLIITGLVNPESVYVIPALPSGSVYISEIGRFGVQDGQVCLISDWKAPKLTPIATDLVDPKGIGFCQMKIWVADVDRVVMIDPPSGKEDVFGPTKFKPHPAFLNDICTTADMVYVSDTQKNVVYEIRKKKIKVFLKLKSPNGIEYNPEDGSLYIASYTRPGKVYKYKEGKLKLIYSSRDIDGTDGLALCASKDVLFISGYLSGKVIALNLSNGKILGKLDRLSNPADIAFDERTNTLFIPEMSAGRVSEYRVVFRK